jgi:hypothetical protein
LNSKIQKSLQYLGASKMTQSFPSANQSFAPPAVSTPPMVPASATIMEFQQNEAAESAKQERAPRVRIQVEKLDLDDGQHARSDDSFSLLSEELPTTESLRLSSPRRNRSSLSAMHYEDSPRRPRVSFFEQRSRRSSIMNSTSEQLIIPPDYIPNDASRFNLSEDQQRLALSVGVDVLTEQISKNHGFDPDVTRDILEHTGDFSKTDECARLMREAAQSAGEKYIEQNTSRSNNRRSSLLFSDRAYRPGIARSSNYSPAAHPHIDNGPTRQSRMQPRTSRLGLQYTPAAIEPDDIPYSPPRSSRAGQLRRMGLESFRTEKVHPSQRNSYRESSWKNDETHLPPTSDAVSNHVDSDSELLSSQTEDIANSPASEDSDDQG